MANLIDRLIPDEPSPDHHDCVINRKPAISGEGWMDVLYRLEAVLAEVFTHERAFVCVTAEGTADRFVQAARRVDGSLILEASSMATEPCPEDPPCPSAKHIATNDELLALEYLGWRVPWPVDGSRNLSRELDLHGIGVPAMCSLLMVQTMHRVFKAEPHAIRARYGRLPLDGSVVRDGVVQDW